MWTTSPKGGPVPRACGPLEHMVVPGVGVVGAGCTARPEGLSEARLRPNQ